MNVNGDGRFSRRDNERQSKKKRSTQLADGGNGSTIAGRPLAKQLFVSRFKAFGEQFAVANVTAKQFSTKRIPNSAQARNIASELNGKINEMISRFGDERLHGRKAR